MGALLEIDGVSKRYGQVRALEDMSFTVRPGELFGFVGANGAGKTTTMRIVLGVLAADSGEVRLDGRPLDARRRRRIGYLPEERGLYPRMGVGEQLRYLAQLHGLSAAAARRATEQWAERLGVAARLTDEVQRLSLGNQQRVQLAAALVHDPDVLVLDEPFSGLDPVAVDVISEVLRERCAAGAPAVFSSHQLDLVERLCDRVGIVRDGTLVAEGTVDGLRAGAGADVVVDAPDAAPAGRTGPRRRRDPGRGRPPRRHPGPRRRRPAAAAGGPGDRSGARVRAPPRHADRAVPPRRGGRPGRGRPGPVGARPGAGGVSGVVAPLRTVALIARREFLARVRGRAFVSAASHQRAADAAKNGRFDAEIVPVPVPQRKGDPIEVTEDEGVRGDTTAEGMGKLRPAFSKDGIITAGSSSQISDGAAATLVMSAKKAQELGLTPLAEIRSHGWVAGPDNSLLSQPSNAAFKAMRREGIEPSDVELWEINEAFAAVAIQSARELGLDSEKVNTDGGAIALGHPVGATGARLAVHAAHELQRRGGGYAVASLCGGGGQGSALILHV